MTSDGIEDDDWDRICELAVDDALAGCLRLAGDETEIADYEALEAAWARLSGR